MSLKNMLYDLVSIKDKISGGNSKSAVRCINRFLYDILPHELRPTKLEKNISVNSDSLRLLGLNSRSVESIKVSISDLEYPLVRYTNQSIADIKSFHEALYNYGINRFVNREALFSQLQLNSSALSGYFSRLAPYVANHEYLNAYSTIVAIFDTNRKSLTKTPIVELKFYKASTSQIISSDGFYAHLEMYDKRITVFTTKSGTFECRIWLPTMYQSGLIYIDDNGLDVYGTRYSYNMYHLKVQATVAPMLMTHIDDSLDKDLIEYEQLIAHGSANQIMLAHGGTISTDIAASYREVLSSYLLKLSCKRNIRNDLKRVIHSTR